MRHPASAAAPVRGADRSSRVPAIVGDLQHAIADAHAGEVGGAAGRHLGHLGIQWPRQVGRTRQPQRLRVGQRTGIAPARNVKPAPAGKAVGRVTNSWTPT